MRKKEDESYEEWANRVTMFEKGRALQKIAEGEPIEKIMDEMGRRITEKLLHPVFAAIKETSKTEYDPVKSREEYFEKMKYHSPAADHISDD